MKTFSQAILARPTHAAARLGKAVVWRTLSGQSSKSSASNGTATTTEITPGSWGPAGAPVSLFNGNLFDFLNGEQHGKEDETSSSSQ